MHEIALSCESVTKQNLYLQDLLTHIHLYRHYSQIYKYYIHNKLIIYISQLLHNPLQWIVITD